MALDMKSTGLSGGNFGTELDDYEEGTFTLSNAADTGWTWTLAYNNYVKNGNLMHCGCNQDFTGVGTADNGWWPGLPFPSRGPEIGSTQVKELKAVQYTQYACLANGSNIYIYGHATTAGWTIMSYVDCDTSTEWYWTITYQTN